jgi:hypothetical protein
MKAIVQDTYGSTAVREFRDIAPPVPKDNEVLVRGARREAASGRLAHHDRPAVPDPHRCPNAGTAQTQGRHSGHGCGRARRGGRRASGFQPGDAVFGWCDGSFAEYACVRTCSS